ncbi:MAG: TolC family protein [Fuerstiella sp.]|nr:TolC family protein [Fuerstiella sp.]MCP4856015.1 TolC family protein [Fuerstiella sp.]
MQTRLWQIPLAAVVMLGPAGCQTSSRSAQLAKVANQNVPDDTQDNGVATHVSAVAAYVRAATSSETDFFSESAKIRDTWQTQNFASVYGADATDSLVRKMDTERPGSEQRLAVVTNATIFGDAGSIHDQNQQSSVESAIPVIQASSAEVIDEADSPPAVPPDGAEQEAFPVDLPTILRLAGGRNWAVQLAGERIHQAQADVMAAEAMWLPSLNVGVGATKHEGQIQATTGEILDVSRNSLFVGGGAKVANAPLTGGAGGPARLFLDLSIADALFQPLVARQKSCAAQYHQAVAFNDAQLEGTLAYFDLVSAQGEAAINAENLSDAAGLLSMTQAFVAAGKASPAEVSRVQVIVANHQQSVVDAQLKIRLASSELIRIVRLDPSQLSTEALLYSADDHLLPIELISEASDLSALIAQGQGARPEVGEQHALTQAQLANNRNQELRPFIPSLNLGVSAGGFGGGMGSDIDRFDGRADIDAMLVWEVRNLGFGERAARGETSSRYRQAVLRSHQVQDQIAEEVRSAWHRVRAGRQRMDISRDNVSEAVRLVDMNFERIRGLEGLPLEAIQALHAVSQARLSYLRAIVKYNKAQADLLRAIGRPIPNATSAAEPNA